MRRACKAVVVLLLALSVNACGATHSASTADAPRRAPTTVQVTNNNWSDMVIYVIRSTMRVRLGMVNSMNTTTFQLPASVSGPTTTVRLEANPIGSPQPYLTPAVNVWPGQQIELTIQNHLAVSSVAVR
jgi:hypothetical protein